MTLSTAVIWSKSKPDVEFQYGERLGVFHSMSSQSHVSHCRVLPLGEFTVMIPEPHATLQGAVTWRNQCRDRTTLQGVIIPSAILKVVFRHIVFYAVWALTSGGFHIVSDTLVLLDPSPQQKIVHVAEVNSLTLKFDIEARVGDFHMSIRIKGFL